MWYLTNNKVEFEGHTFVQIKRPLSNGKFQFGGYVEEKLPHIRGDFWADQNSYIFGDCEINGKVRIHKNCIIKNSQLHNNMILGDNCAIIDSTIKGHHTYSTLFEQGCVIEKQQFICVGKYPPFYFQDGKIETDTYNGVILTMTQNYCKVNCLIMTYETAWNYLNDADKWEFIKSKHPDVPEVYYEDTKKWLYYWCEKQLKRKEGRAE